VAKDEGAEVGSSAAANAIGDPMTTKHERFTKSHHDAMEVHGFDLLAQVEAMLRHVREYQREVQRLRGTLLKGQTSTSNRRPVDAAREHVTQLRRVSEKF